MVDYVTQIERIQNLELYQQYSVRKRRMEQTNGAQIENEKWLWHGTAAENAPKINSQGFNRSFAGIHGW